MSASDVRDARATLARGDVPRAVRQAWAAATNAAARNDESALDELARIAADAASLSEGSTAEEALRLKAYCEAAVVVPSKGVIQWLRRPWGSDRSRRNCPDCAESIAADAKVCRFCGFRLAEPPSV